jgi:VIT1/CCC1 family predicted Fe2+/Mn2+ transporter
MKLDIPLIIFYGYLAIAYFGLIVGIVVKKKAVWISCLVAVGLFILFLTYMLTQCSQFNWET